MATVQELLAQVGVKPIPNTGLQTMSGRLPNQAPQSPQSAPVRPQQAQGAPGLSDRIFAAIGQQNAAQQPQQQAPDQPWYKKALGTVLGNGVVKTATKPLGWLAYPGAAVTNTVGEILDVVGKPLAQGIEAIPGMSTSTDWENNNPYDGSFDLGQLWDNIKNKKGFGERIVEPATQADGVESWRDNKWTKRTAGLAGDLAADPLLKVTAGAASASGKGNRVAAAARAGAAEMGDDVVARAMKGAAFLKPAEREALGIPAAGFRVGGELIPGTAGASTAIGKGTGYVRNALQGTDLWQAVARKPVGLEDAYKVLQTGKGTITNPTLTHAAQVVAWDEAARLGGKTFLNQIETKLGDIFKDMTPEQRVALTHAQEAGDPNIIRPVMAWALTEARQRGVPIGKIEDYMPHIWDPEARTFLAGRVITDKTGKQILINKAGASSASFKRQFRDGIIDIDGIPVDLGTGTIKEINQALTDAFPDMQITKWLEDDSANLASAYAGMLAKDIGIEAGYERVASNPQLDEALKTLSVVQDETELFKKFEAMTQFFKTYATATPGFHVRNALSAGFNNLINGVSMRDHVDAFRAWSNFERAPTQYMRTIEFSNPELYDAFKASFGSGAGGSFSAAELGTHPGNRILNNKVTNASKQVGRNIEGPMRLALALNTTRNGGDALSALARVSDVHFDYSQVSNLDRKIKQAVPFWTFQSRNAPLQVKQMAMRPGGYLAAGHVADNMQGEGEGMPLPEWLSNRSAIPISGDAQNGGLAVAPDLPFLNMMEDWQNLDPRDPEKALSNVNPILTAPLEALAGRDFYTGREFGSAGERLMNVVNGVAPPVATAQRLAGVGRYDGLEMEKWANFLGIPLYQVTPERIAAELRRRAATNG